MTDPCVTPSITSPFNMRGSGDVLGTNEPLTVMEDDIEKISLSSRYKRSKIALIVSAGQKWVRLDKEYIHSYWISDAKI